MLIAIIIAFSGILLYFLLKPPVEVQDAKTVVSKSPTEKAYPQPRRVEINEPRMGRRQIWKTS